VYNFPNFLACLPSWRSSRTTWACARKNRLNILTHTISTVLLPQHPGWARTYWTHYTIITVLPSSHWSVFSIYCNQRHLLFLTSTFSYLMSEKLLFIMGGGAKFVGRVWPSSLNTSKSSPDYVESEWQCWCCCNSVWNKLGVGQISSF